ncbi:MBL fold metallo-hydrolase [Patescibacteria group bacterium]|nr:MBL fold metallo-hydrolase [Patescibacteria group bacterium]
MKNTQIKSALLFILLVCLGFAIDFLQSPKAYSGNEDVQICVFDVGQGDSILIASGDEQILVDGGPSSVILEKLEKAMPFWDRKIELIVNTHPHADHVTGLNFVLDRYAVDTVWSSGLQYSTAVKV